MSNNNRQFYAKQWQLNNFEKIIETHSSSLYWCQQNHNATVLKIYKSHGDEANSGNILAHYDGAGAVKALEFDQHAILIEQVGIGANLTSQNEQVATKIYCDIVTKLHRPSSSALNARPMIDMLGGFDQYLNSGIGSIDRQVIIHARDMYQLLCETQGQPLVLHGDLHHYNILKTDLGQWLAIDPKGYFGEAECELGAYLRNPINDMPSRTSTIDARLSIIEQNLNLNMDRVIKWAYCQAVLAAIWAGTDTKFRDHMLCVACAYRMRLA